MNIRPRGLQLGDLKRKEKVTMKRKGGMFSNLHEILDLERFLNILHMI